MKIKDGFVLRCIADEYVVIPVGNSFANSRIMLALNDTAAFIWKKLIDGTDIQSIAIALCEEYDLTYENAIQDITQFCKELDKRNMLGE